jgi:hypothetical protein
MAELAKKQLRKKIRSPNWSWLRKEKWKNTTVSCCACNYVDSRQWKKILAFSNNAFRRAQARARQDGFLPLDKDLS